MENRSIRELALDMGFSEVGFCGADGFGKQRTMVEMQPELAERRQLRYEPEADFPWAKSIVVLLWAYHPAPMPDHPGQVFIDSYYQASNQAYHAAKRLEEALIEQGVQARANVSYPAKTAAVRAGLGVIGDNGLLITPMFGTRVVIILMAIDAETTRSKTLDGMNDCLHCGKCIAACPVAALDAQGMTNPERCLRNYMMEGIIVPPEVRSKMGNGLIGCDRCQRVCPMQTMAERPLERKFMLDEIVTDDAALFKASVGALAQPIGRNAARPQRVRAQAAILAGNRGSAEDLPVLRHWAESTFEAVREHARWAIKRIESHMQGLDQSHETR